MKHLAFMSAVGADPTASTRGSGAAGMARYARVKGEAEAVTPQANLFDDLGLDSIDLMSAVMAIEERFEIEVSDAELENVTTVGEAVEILGAKVAASA